MACGLPRIRMATTGTSASDTFIDIGEPAYPCRGLSDIFRGAGWQGQRLEAMRSEGQGPARQGEANVTGPVTVSGGQVFAP